MNLLAVSVGLPREVETDAGLLRTGIFKSPVSGRRWVSPTQIEGDGQADRTVHGGPEKAAYAYPSEHYALWRDELGMPLPDWGAFGENLTTSGLLESAVYIGDRFRVGSAEFMVTQPRMPCHKLTLRFGRADMIKRFVRVDRSGFYLAVEREGEVGAGDEIVPLSRDARGLSVAAVYRLKIDGGPVAAIEEAASHPALSAGWRESFRQRLESSKSGS